MSSHNEQVTPTPFDVAQPTPPLQSAESVRTPQRAPRWVLPALGGLLLIAVLVFFWLPDRVGPAAPGSQDPAATSVAAEASQAMPAAKPAATETDASPWSEAQLAKLRKKAQDVLAELLDVQAGLEERGVQLWAAEEFTQASAIAMAGDELYKSREFEQATTRYEEALAAMLALEQGLPERMAALLEQARQAIESGDQQQADTTLDQAQLIEPGSAPLATLRQRAAVLPQLLPLLEQAAAAEQNGDLAGAQQSLQQATALDTQHLRARDELQRVTAAHRTQRFNDAMSEGYAALDEGRFDSARKAFRAAATLQEGSSEAASALQEVAVAETAYRLSRLKKSGQRLEDKEQWQQAVKAYEDAQQIDGNVLFAAEGLKRSRARAGLDKQFRKVLEQPQRLSDVSVANATEQLLRQAGKITPRGTLLDQQINQLNVLLQQANTPVAVTLLSDMETEVILLKVKKLGRFAQQELTLRPGTYTATGRRNGYRDVRQSFTVVHDGKPPAINVICTETI
jgi:tetratricopeptide (TPR) repeat protein